MDIITNPPFKLAQQFIEHAHKVTDGNAKIAMFLKLQFLEGEKRKQFFADYPPHTVYVFSKRVKCAKNGEFEKVGAPVMAYAWYVWKKGWHGDTTIKWI